MKNLALLAGGWCIAVFVLGSFGQIAQPHLPMIGGLLVLIGATGKIALSERR